VHIDKLWIDGLRGLKDAEIRFHPGLNVLVGENNAGKTTILMALRLVLSASDEVDRPFLCVDDLHMGEDGPVDAIQIECTLGGLSPADQGRMLEALIATTAPPTAKVAVTVVKTESGKLKVRHWCGTSKDNALPSALLDWMGLAFLPPLRDPTRGLLPGRRSQFASLLSELTTKEEVAELEKAVKAANDDLSLEAAVVRTREAVNSALVAVTGPELAQNATLGFTASDFEQLLHTLSARVDGLSVSQNGLGYNNLLYTATVLAALRKDSDLSFRLFLVEEPEAHLHPHLQALLYRYLAETAEDAPKTQLFVSTHSTHIASAVDPRKCVVLNASGGFKAMRLSDIELKPRSWNKLGRYLDATRSSLLFARRVILVEGISEAILISAIARACGYDLRDYSVSVVSTEGLNFSEFMSLLGAKGLGRRCAVVTDADGVLFGKRYYPGARGPSVLLQPPSFVRLPEPSRCSSLVPPWNTTWSYTGAPIKTSHSRPLRSCTPDSWVCSERRWSNTARLSRERPSFTNFSSNRGLPTKWSLRKPWQNTSRGRRTSSCLTIFSVPFSTLPRRNRACAAASLPSKRLSSTRPNTAFLSGPAQAQARRRLPLDGWGRCRRESTQVAM